MYSKANAEGYALALFELAKEQKILKKVHHTLIGLYEAIKNDNKLINLLSSYEISKEEKNKYIDLLLKNYDQNQLISKFIKVVVDTNNANLLKRIIYQFLKLSNNELKIKFAKLYTAFDITESQKKKIKMKLEKKYQNEIILEHFVDPNLISGFKVVINSDVIEKSYSKDLKNIELLITKKGV